MDTKKMVNSQKNKFLKLSLKKNRLKQNEESKNFNRSSDVIIIEDSCDQIQLDFPKTMQPTLKISSPIVINDSSEMSRDESSHLVVDKQPSKNGNVSFNRSAEELSIIEIKDSRPSIGGWSPAQHIIQATPKYETVPSTPKEIANESFEQCSIKKIQQSQKKLLDDLYGEAWKSVPKLFKPISRNNLKFGGASKKLQFDDDDDESDKENIKHELEINKQLYLTRSDAKKIEVNYGGTEKKSRKKLFTEKIPSTPDIPRTRVTKPRNFNSTTKKVKGMTVTELVEIMRKDVDVLTKGVENVSVDDTKEKVDGTNKTVDVFKNEVDILRNKVDVLLNKTNVCVTPINNVKTLTFMGSLADNVPSWRCHPEALQYINNYKKGREELTRRLYVEFNRLVFDNELEEDMPILWDAKLRSTAGTTTNRSLKNSKGERRRTSCIKLSTKVVDGPQRLRDTLIHELCHAATWLLDGELRAGHGPLWKKWATHALRKIPELGEISRCHDLQIHFKYTYKCTQCGYSISRHSKSIDNTKKCCGYCRGTFELIINKKNKDGVVISTPARKGGPNDFAIYVKENYSQYKNGRSHADVMKLLGEQFSAKKKLCT